MLRKRINYFSKLRNDLKNLNSLSFKDEKLDLLKLKKRNIKKEYYNNIAKLTNKPCKLSLFYSIINRNNEEISNLKSSFKVAKVNIQNELNEYKKTFEYHKQRNLKFRGIKDLLRGFNSFFFAFLIVALLIWIVVYIFATGSGKLTLEKIFGNYKTDTYSLKTENNFVLSNDLDFSDLDLSNPNVSKKWGVEFKLLSVNDKSYVAINKVSENSPFNYLINSNNDEVFKVGFEGLYISSMSVMDSNNYLNVIVGQTTIENFIAELDKGVKIVDSTFLGEGGGFRGSLLNTLALIGLSLLFAFPLGVGAAIYLGVYAKGTKVTSIIRSLIDMISGVPSIIFGLAGALIFIPVASLIPGTNGGNLLSGALTMAMILLPTIVKTVEESIKVIPKSLTQASLALGANKTETVFKVVLPNSLPGILTSLLLSIGRIIGESAALVFAMGTTIAEYANMSGSNATLAVHIWVILGGDHPAYDNACAIAIVIIIIVLILTLLIKLIAYKMNKFKVR